MSIKKANETAVVCSLKDQSAEPVDDKRRRFAKAGFAAPVIMTLASRPVFGKQCSGSALASGNLSNPVDTATCGACTERQWYSTTLKEWAELVYDPDTDIGEVINIPDVKTKQGSFPVLIGSLAQVLASRAVVSRQVKFIDNSGQKRSALKCQSLLQHAASIAVAALCNASHPATRFNYGYRPVDVITAFESALAVYKKRLNIDSIVAVKELLAAANGNGASCALD